MKKLSKHTSADSQHKKPALPSGRRKMAPNGNMCLHKGITSTHKCVGSTKEYFPGF